MSTAAICNSYKRDVMTGKFLSGHSYKMALYTSAATLDKNTTAYTATNEISGTGYTAGGKALTGFTAGLDTDTGTLDFADVTWPTASFTARSALIYDDTLAGKDAVCVLDFGADKTASGGDFTFVFPAPDAVNALLHLT